MGKNHIFAVFKAEYYTSTSKFRNYRKWLPIIFLSSVFIFSLILREIYQYFSNDQLEISPPLTSLYSILAIFSYFTLFTPLLSPIGRMVYDGSARSRREVALASPVKSRDLLYGNLLSNLAFFLPFFAFIGTISLSPFIGSGNFNPLITSIILFIVLSLLILIGLIAGTLISPLIFNFVSNQESGYARAIITFLLSILLITSLPLLRYLLEHVSLENDAISVIDFLPFTIAASTIIFVLYGVEIGLGIHWNISLLFFYIFLIFILGYYFADIIYGMERDSSVIKIINPKSKSNRFIDLLTSILPKSIRNITRSIFKATVRDIEHLSRLTIGISITIFMVFALSSRGLFRTTSNIPEEIEFTVVFFAITISVASVIFIEASSFTIQHRDMLAMIKSAPNGPRKFVISKLLQMYLLLTPLFVILIPILVIFNLVSLSILFDLILILIPIIFYLISISLSIYLVNPTDNEEDITNFINLLIFYSITFLSATIPVFFLLSDYNLGGIGIIIILLFLAFASIFAIIISIEALERMNLETLESDLSRTIIQFFKSIIITFGIWNIFPLLLLPLLFSVNIIVYLILSSFLVLTTSSLIWMKNLDNISVNIQTSPKFTNILGNLRSLSSSLLLMILVAGVILVISQIFVEQSTASIFSLLDLPQTLLIIYMIITTIAEEVFFRGFLIDYNRKYMDKKLANIFSSIIFALTHIYSIFSVVNAFFQGLILVNLRYKTKNILYPAIIHLIYNMIILGLI